MKPTPPEIPPPPKNTRHAILDILKREGSQEAKALARSLGITPMAVGLQLASLAEEKLVAAEPEPARPTGSALQGKRGRPGHRWTLTEAANRVFPDAHALLTAGLLGSLQEIYGAQGMQKLLDARTRQQLEEYGRSMPVRAGLKQKVEALTRLRDREGYMAEMESAPGGGFRLIENHCPICTAARTCQGFCQSEWQLFSKVIGPGVRVTREEHLLSGARRCVYSITPAPPGPADRAPPNPPGNGAKTVNGGQTKGKRIGGMR